MSAELSLGELFGGGLMRLGVQVLILLVAVLGVLVPALGLAERRHAARVEGRGPSALADPGMGGLLEPGARIFKLLAQGVPGSGPSGLGAGVPMLLVLFPLLAFAVMPFGGQYTLGEYSFSPVLADVEAGILYVFALASLGVLVTVWEAAARGGTAALLGAFRVAARSLSGDLALLFALLPMLLIFGSLHLGEMVEWQDTDFALFALPGALLGAAADFGPSWPAWGIFLNLPAFVLFLVAALARLGLPPFDAERSEAELAGGHSARHRGADAGLLVLAARLQQLLVAALVVVIFLGGWALPWLAQETVLETVGGFLGSGLANLICLALHVFAFGLKLAWVVWLQLILGSALPGFGPEQARRLCWKVLVPAALIDLTVTVAALGALTAGSA